MLKVNYCLYVVGKVLTDTTALRASPVKHGSKVMLVATQGLHQGVVYISLFIYIVNYLLCLIGPINISCWNKIQVAFFCSTIKLAFRSIVVDVWDFDAFLLGFHIGHFQWRYLYGNYRI